jgi:hypothetical protein
MISGRTCLHQKLQNVALVVNTLKAIYTAPSGWAGNETLNAALMVLTVLASIPDDRQ